MDQLKNKNIVICGALRNNEKYIETVFKNIYAITSLFKSYKIILYENDSNDNTVSILKSYMDKDTNLICCFESNVDNIYKYRTERLSYIRNKLLNHTLENYTTYDYLLNMDMDDVNSTPEIVDTFHHIFDYNEDLWDVQSINQRVKYYDIWAYRKRGLIEHDCWFEVKCDLYNKVPYEVAYEKYIGKFEKPFKMSKGLIPVLSAFGGAAIYKISKLKEGNDIKYNGICHYGEICEHVYFHQILKNKYNAKIFINPMWINKD